MYFLLTEKYHQKQSSYVNTEKTRLIIRGFNNKQVAGMFKFMVEGTVTIIFVKNFVFYQR